MGALAVQWAVVLGRPAHLCLLFTPGIPPVVEAPSPRGEEIMKEGDWAEL